MNARIQPIATRPLEDKIAVPELESDCIDQLVERMSRRTGESPARCRPKVQLEVIRLGIAKMQEVLSP